MAFQELKKERVSFIENSDNENRRSLLKEDISFYSDHKITEVTNGLSEAQLAGLNSLVEEPIDKDTMRFDEFTAATERWRIK